MVEAVGRIAPCIQYAWERRERSLKPSSPLRLCHNTTTTTTTTTTTCAAAAPFQIRKSAPSIGRNRHRHQSWGFLRKEEEEDGRGGIGSASSSIPPPQDLDDDAPTSIDLHPITTEEQFDRTIAEAQQLEEPILVVWMAGWCRKCIYLKPKLEKLAADYYPSIHFFCIDVNTVPQRLVNRAGVTKMPTIQLWKDCKKQAEVIGGHKAWLVVDDVREMIQNVLI